MARVARVLVVLACAAVGALAQESRAESAPESRAATRPVDVLAIEAALRARLAQPMAGLDLDLVMFGPEFFGDHPDGMSWSDDAQTLFFRWRRPGEADDATFAAEVSGGALRRFEKGELRPRSGVLTRDGRRRLLVKKNALVLETIPPTTPTTLVLLAEPPADPRFDATETGATFQVGSALYAVDFARPGMRALLTWRNGDKPAPAASAAASRPSSRPSSRPESAPVPRGKRLAEQMEREQLALFRRLFERHEKKAAESRPKDRPDDLEARKFTAPDGFDVGGVSPAPDGRFAVVEVSKPGDPRPRADEMPDYVTESGYVEPRHVRAKAGESRDESRTFVVDLASGKSVEVVDPPGASPAHVRRTSWSADGKWLVGHAQSEDRSHVFLVRIDPATGATKVIYHHEDPAWTFFDDGWGGFIGGTAQFWFVSEATGWRNLRVVDLAHDDTLTAIAPGAYEVSDVRVDREGRFIVAVASWNSPHAREVVYFDARDFVPHVVTKDGGMRAITLSADGRWIAEVWSKPNRPPELRLCELKSGELLAPRTLTDSPSKAFRSFAFQEPPIVRIPTDGGCEIPARVYRPAQPRAGGPGVLFVHGAGYLQNVHDGWSSYEREYAFHHFLVEHGYTVVDIDYRGSAGYGRAFRAAVKGAVGEADTNDCVAAARWLVEHEGCGRERLGIYGGSYGGFLTLMALFKHPGVFHAGAALRPVTDWGHYHEGYTGNLLDDPLDQEAAYRRASPITWAAGLSDHLLICHGLVDDNVLAQDSIRLVQRLIELRKKDFELALFPLESHGFVDAASWSDEYRRIFALFERVLKP